MAPPRGSQRPASTASKGSSDIRFKTDESAQLKVKPETVLVISLVYIGIVVLLHIIGKIRGGDHETE